MKYLLVLCLLFSGAASGQTFTIDSSVKWGTSMLIVKDSCFWERKVDTIKVAFIIYAEVETGIVKYVVPEEPMIHSYDMKWCEYSMFPGSKGIRNENYSFKAQKRMGILIAYKKKNGDFVAF